MRQSKDDTESNTQQTEWNAHAASQLRFRIGCRQPQLLHTVAQQVGVGQHHFSRAEACYSAPTNDLQAHIRQHDKMSVQTVWPKAKRSGPAHLADGAPHNTVVLYHIGCAGDLAVGDIDAATRHDSSVARQCACAEAREQM